METKEKAELLTGVSLLLQETHSWLNGTLESLGWTKDHLMQKSDVLVVCPNNSSHLMSLKSLKSHKEICPLLDKGYSKTDAVEATSPCYFYEKASNVVPVVISSEVEERILNSLKPETVVNDPSSFRSNVKSSMTDVVRDLKPEQRLAIHTYCVEKAKRKGAFQQVNEDDMMMLEEKTKDKDDLRKSYLDKQAEQRDAKRQRTKYTGKSTHTKNKSHKEVLAQVIGNQMDALTDIWKKDLGVLADTSDEDESPSVRESHSPDMPQRYRDVSASPKRGRSKRRERKRSRSPGPSHSGRKRSRSRSQSTARSRKKSSSRDRDERHSKHKKSHKHHKHKHRRDEKHRREEKHRHKDKHSKHKDSEPGEAALWETSLFDAVL